MSKQKTTTSKPNPNSNPNPNWPSKKPGMPSGPKRGNGTPKPKK